MNANIDIDEFCDFARAAALLRPGKQGIWLQVPSWLKPYWGRHTTMTHDHTLFQHDLAANNPAALAVYTKFIAWRLTK